MVRSRLLRAAHQALQQEPTQGAYILAARNGVALVLDLDLHPLRDQRHTVPGAQRFRRTQARPRESQARRAHPGGGRDSLRTQPREIEQQETFVGELQALKTEVARVAPLWKPTLDDGVILTFALLLAARAAELELAGRVQEGLDKLVAGDYDWAHLAMHLWPAVVAPKCIDDRSLAIAHGLEDVFWHEEDSGTWRKSRVDDATVQKLTHERTSTTVKAALEDLLSAATPTSKGRTANWSASPRASAQKPAPAAARTTAPDIAVHEATLRAVKAAIPKVADGASKADGPGRHRPLGRRLEQGHRRLARPRRRHAHRAEARHALPRRLAKRRRMTHALHQHIALTSSTVSSASGASSCSTICVRSFDPSFDELDVVGRGVGDLPCVCIHDTLTHVARFEGSFFVLKATVEPILAAPRPEPVLVYVPGFAKERLGKLRAPATPNSAQGKDVWNVLFELDCAGKSYEPSLRGLAWNELRRRCTDGDIDEMLAPESLTYHDVVRFLLDEGGAAGGSGSLVKLVLGNGSSEELICRWLANEARDELEAKQAAPELLLEARPGAPRPLAVRRQPGEGAAPDPPLRAV